MGKPFVTKSVEIRELPEETDRILNTLAAMRGMTKRDIIREALVEYAKNHEAEIRAFRARGSGA